MGSRSRPLGTLGGEPSPAGGTGGGRLGGLATGTAGSAGGGGPSAPAAGGGAAGCGVRRSLTPAERFRPKPQPRTTTRRHVEPKPDSDAAPSSTRATRGRGAATVELAPDNSPSDRRAAANGVGETGAAPPPRIKPDPDGEGGCGAAPMAVDRRSGRHAAASSSSSSDDERPHAPTASGRLRSSAGAAFPYAAKLARAAPPPVELAPPPPATPPGGSAAHFPVSSFGTGLDGGLTLLQLPARLPAAAGPGRTPAPEGDADASGGSGGCASIADLPPGVIGRVLVLASGAVKVHIGEIEFDLAPGMPVDALAAGVLLGMSPAGSGGGVSQRRRGGGGACGGVGGPSSSTLPPAARAASFGQVINRATLVPDVARLLGGAGAPVYRRAAMYKGPRDLDAAAAAAASAAAAALTSPGGGRGRAVVSSGEEEEAEEEAKGRTNGTAGRAGRARPVVMEESE